MTSSSSEPVRPASRQPPYGASEGLATVVVEAVATGGQAGTSPRIENYLGFPAGISGAELAERAVIQAEKFGTQIIVPAETVALEEGDARYAVRLDDGTSVVGLAPGQERSVEVVVATCLGREIRDGCGTVAARGASGCRGRLG